MKVSFSRTVAGAYAVGNASSEALALVQAAEQVEVHELRRVLALLLVDVTDALERQYRFVGVPGGVVQPELRPIPIPAAVMTAAQTADGTRITNLNQLPTASL